ncbi:MAG: hypothetical protein ABIH00_03480 [Armatimonadota bacterium]
MNIMKNLWTKKEVDFFKKLKNPDGIQKLVSSLSYNTDPVCRSPRYVIKTRKAHCFDGALFAAAALRQQGYKSLIIDLRAHNDDDHVIAVFKKNGHWGAIAKSNFTTLQYREPVYRTLRELVMSYFDFYFNSMGEKTLREYSVPLDLSRFDKSDWMRTEEDISYIGDYLDGIKHYKIVTPSMIRNLAKTDKKLLKAGLLGSDPRGLYRP